MRGFSYAASAALILGSLALASSAMADPPRAGMNGEAQMNMGTPAPGATMNDRDADDANSNGRNAMDRDKGRDRAEDRAGDHDADNRSPDADDHGAKSDRDADDRRADTDDHRADADDQRAGKDADDRRNDRDADDRRADTDRDADDRAPR